MAKQLLSEQEALNDVREAINEVLGNRWMIAVWCVEEAAKEGEPNIFRPVKRITWRFPSEDYAAGIGKLCATMFEEKRSTTPPLPVPLKVADFLRKEEEEVEGEEKGMDEQFKAGTGLEER